MPRTRSLRPQGEDSPGFSMPPLWPPPTSFQSLSCPCVVSRSCCLSYTAYSTAASSWYRTSGIIPSLQSSPQPAYGPHRHFKCTREVRPQGYLFLSGMGISHGLWMLPVSCTHKVQNEPRYTVALTSRASELPPLCGVPLCTGFRPCLAQSTVPLPMVENPQSNPYLSC